jgi:hypothetical protein
VKVRLLLVALLVSTALAACGKGETKPASSGDPTTTTTEDTTETTVEETDDAEASSIELEGSEYAYETQDDVTAVPAGLVDVVLSNVGDEEHQVSIAKLREGKTMDDFIALGDDPRNLAAVVETYGGPNAVAPGETGTATASLGPGEYLFVCFIPAADGQPHAAKGMLLPVTVEGEVPEAPVPGDAELTLADYEFGLDDETLTAGEYDIANDGPQPHEIAIYAPVEGKTADDIVEFFTSAAPEGPPPFAPAGGIGPIDPGGWGRITLDGGELVFVCFLPDAADGAPHFTKGMIQVVTVE